MEIYALPEFARRAEKERMDRLDLVEAVARADRGLIDARIDKSLIKQRIARQGQGRSGGFRTILYYEKDHRAVFVHLFAKNATAALTLRETDAYRDFAGILAGLTEEAFLALVTTRAWVEVARD